MEKIGRINRTNIWHAAFSRPCSGILISFIRLALIALCIWYYGKTHWYRDPGSIFFDSRRAFEPRYSVGQERQADAFLITLTKSHIHATPAVDAAKASEPRICATFLTRNSPGREQYLERTISSALATSSIGERRDVAIQILFAGTNDTEPPDIRNRLFDLVDKTHKTSDIVDSDIIQQMILLQANGTYDAKVQKAGLDYTTAIKACMNNGDAPYIAVFEDDVIFSNGWVARTVELLSDLEAQNEHWSDMRLFTPERSMGWSPTTVKLATFLSIAPAILAAVLIPRIRILRKAIDPRTVRWVVPIVVPLTVWFILEAGKYSIFPPSPGLHQQRWGCCTQAIVFSRKTLSEMVPCLDLTVLDRPYDLAIRDCAFSLNLHRWIAQPSLVQHLGFKSLINPNRSSADAVWSVSFEDMDGHAVLQQQKRLVQQIYGSSGILS